MGDHEHHHHEARRRLVSADDEKRRHRPLAFYFHKMRRRLAITDKDKNRLKPPDVTPLGLPLPFVAMLVIAIPVIFLLLYLAIRSDPRFVGKCYVLCELCLANVFY